ncbi:Glycosyl hydrolase family 63 [Trypanosoma melophagium]|uniref:Glycosyl hydrolase family 63 n=2 Tax=Trypanosoma melophagium TaxID=715481 RepID=UPI00351A0710|nr:Glycosyl hydrolase family 63 [Trypanosoma melophagium]
MRDRRPLLAQGAGKEENATGVVRKKSYRPKREDASPPLTFKEIIARIVFFVVILGLPLGIIYYYTPFFIFQRLRCRAVEKLWSDDTITAMEEGYRRYQNSPPRFPSLEYNKTMLWGTYEPGLIFAMKTRTPKPVYIGIAWYDEAGQYPIRYKMSDVLSVRRRQNTNDSVVSDEKSSNFEASWVVHDGVHYGLQLVHDRLLSMNIEFLKSPSGDTWHVRVHGSMDGAKAITFVVYVINEGGDAFEAEKTINIDDSWDPQIKSEFEDAEGRREEFMLTLHDDHNPFSTPSRWQIYGLQAPEGEFLRDVDFRRVPSDAHTYTTESSRKYSWQEPLTGSNTHNVMVFRKRYNSDFRVEMSMRHASHLVTGGQDATLHRPFIATYDALTTCQLTNAFRLREKDILHNMRKLVTPWSNGFPVKRKLYINRARRLLSGALSAWGYWYGRYLYANSSIDDLWDKQGSAVTVHSDEQLHEVANDVSAFGAVASRVEGPYGDVTLTGLQLLFITYWNKEWTKETIASWLVDAQDKSSGFIPRYATFTAASRSIRPPSSRYEHLTFAAPPTILLALRQILSDDQALRKETDFFELLLPSLHRWRDWFHSTQSSRNNNVSLETLANSFTNEKDARYSAPRYRWRSRDGYRVPASGMEDYPRPFCMGSHGDEAHVDLFSWVAFLSIIISDVELHLGLSESVPKRLWRVWLDEVHWDMEHQRYADRVGCPDDSFSPYVGYANLYPFFLELLDDKERALTVLELANTQLMTSYGMMSVSYDSVGAAREAGLRHENLWMGHIWVSTNALMLRALRRKYITLLGKPAEDLFKQLRVSIVATAGGSQTMQEVFNPVTGVAESTVSLVGHRALMLALLEDYN